MGTLRHLINSNNKVKNAFGTKVYKDFRFLDLGSVIDINTQHVVDPSRGILHMIMYITAATPTRKERDSHLNIYYKPDRRKKNDYRVETPRMISTYTSAISFKVDMHELDLSQILRVVDSEGRNRDLKLISLSAQEALKPNSNLNLASIMKEDLNINVFKVYNKKVEIYSILDDIKYYLDQLDSSIPESMGGAIHENTKKQIYSKLKKDYNDLNKAMVDKSQRLKEQVDTIKTMPQEEKGSLYHKYKVKEYMKADNEEELLNKLIEIYSGIFLLSSERYSFLGNITRGGYNTKVISSNNVVLYRTPTVDDEVRVNCTCGQFYYTFAWANFNGQYLVGPKPPAYMYVRKFMGRLTKDVTHKEYGDGTIRNINNTPGLCKHLQFFISYLFQTNKVNIKNSKLGQRHYGSLMAKNKVSQTMRESVESDLYGNQEEIEVAQKELKEYNQDIKRSGTQYSFYKPRRHKGGGK